MQLARFITGSHRPDCSGCPACNEQMALRLLVHRTEAPPVGEFRAAVESEDVPPNGYAIALAKRGGAALVTAQQMAQVTGEPDNPPNGYDLALAARKAGRP
jgi:hypothetical protein